MNFFENSAPHSGPRIRQRKTTQDSCMLCNATAKVAAKPRVLTGGSGALFYCYRDVLILADVTDKSGNKRRETEDLENLKVSRTRTTPKGGAVWRMIPTAGRLHKSRPLLS